jgi:hypothetical protein
MKEKMQIDKIMTSLAVASAMCCVTMAAEQAKAPEATAPESAGWAYELGDGLSYGTASVLSVEVGTQVDSRYITYGVIDGRDPIYRLNATATFCDWFYLGVMSIHDITKSNGKYGGYGPRTGRASTIDSMVGIAHEWELSEQIGTLSVDFCYIYEYFRRYRDEGARCVDDTQYLNLEFELSDGFLPVDPKLWIERDIMLDNGTYVHFELGRDIPIVDGKNEDDDPVLKFRPSVGQGFGNTSRVRGYGFVKNGRELDHGGIMDTTLKGELVWSLGHGVEVTGYVAYSDFLFDSNMRAGARGHNAAWGHCCNHSWNFYGGVGVTFTF